MKNFLRRIVAFLLMLIVVFPFFEFAFVATEPQAELAEEQEEEKEKTSKQSGIEYSCTYNSSAKQIQINGTVTHDLFIAHREYEIQLYKILGDQSADEIVFDENIMPLASSSISIKFNFVIDITDSSDIFSRYFVVLLSPEGEVDFIGSALYPFVTSKYSADATDKSYYKGVSNSSGVVVQTGSGVVIIPVLLDSLINSGSTGYLYSIAGKNVFFDRNYIDDLDQRVKSLSLTGSKVYLQFLLSGTSSLLSETVSDGSAKKYNLPDLDSKDIAQQIFAYCDFLSARYSSLDNGKINGIIIGKNLDDTITYNNSKFSDLSEYSNYLAHYGIIVGVALRNNIPDADVAYSFSNVSLSGLKEGLSTFNSMVLIANMCGYFDEFYSDDFDFSLVIESDVTSLSFVNNNIYDGIDLRSNDNGQYMNENTIDQMSSFIDSLENVYSSAPKSFMYVWNADKELSGNSLCCVYTYLYYKMFSVDKLTSFVVNISENEERIYDLLNILKYIDTSKGFSVTSQLLQFFGKTSWYDVISELSEEELSYRSYSLADPVNLKSQKIVGRFSYFDYSNQDSNYNWLGGIGCGSVLFGNSSYGYSLNADFSFQNLDESKNVYLLCKYDYPENFVYTPYLTLSFSIEGEDTVSEIFEVKFSVGNSTNRYEISQIVHSFEMQTMTIDISEFSESFYADNFCISIRPISECEGNYSICIDSIVGSSNTYDSNTLANLIGEERVRIRDLSVDDEKSSDNGANIVKIAAIAVIAAIIGIMLFVFLRREESEE